MEASPKDSRAQQVLGDADVYVRENPIPAVLCALGIGLAIGLLLRALDKPSASEVVEDKVDEARSFLNSLFAPVAQQTRRAYYRSAGAVRDAVDTAKEEVEDYTDPLATWFSRLWKKCCS